MGTKITLESIDQKFDAFDKKFDESFKDLVETIIWSHNTLDAKIGAVDTKLDFKFGQLERRIDHLAESKVSYGD